MTVLNDRLRLRMRRIFQLLTSPERKDELTHYERTRLEEELTELELQEKETTHASTSI